MDSIERARGHKEAFDCQLDQHEHSYSKIHIGKPFVVPVSPPVRFEGAKIAFFLERAIVDKFWSSTAPALRFLAVSLVF